MKNASSALFDSINITEMINKACGTASSSNHRLNGISFENNVNYNKSTLNNSPSALLNLFENRLLAIFSTNLSRIHETLVNLSHPKVKAET